MTVIIYAFRIVYEKRKSMMIVNFDKEARIFSRINVFFHESLVKYTVQAENLRLAKIYGAQMLKIYPFAENIRTYSKIYSPKIIKNYIAE